tara:strand:+ start:851 stop:1069 length:219 start_codon:yes stop_codon:yes gene_type:complete
MRPLGESTMNVAIGDKVKVIDQEITGTVIEDYGNKVVIEEDDAEIELSVFSEFEDDTLLFFKSDLELNEGPN